MISRNTIQRQMVMDAVKDLQCHATANEVYDFICTSHPTISRGTVYRNLKQLSDAGRILKIENVDGPERYDHNCHDHYHIQCVGCGRVFDVEMDYMQDMAARVKSPDGFALLGHNITFKGLCPACNHI